MTTAPGWYRSKGDEMAQAITKKRTLDQMLNYLMPTLEQANDVKAWAERRIRRMRKRKGRAA